MFGNDVATLRVSLSSETSLILSSSGTATTISHLPKLNSLTISSSTSFSTIMSLPVKPISATFESRKFGISAALTKIN